MRLAVAHFLLLSASFLLTGSGRAAEFVGSQACASCHAGIYQSFLRTPMACSSPTVNRGCFAAGWRCIPKTVRLLPNRKADTNGLLKA